MKKRKILKTISLAGLAVVIGAAGIFAFAPIGASASEPPATTTTGLGLDPKNDPVVYTTESGLQIKYGGFDVEESLSSGALTGYPYFTMGKYNGYDVNWVIIGRNPDVTQLNTAVKEYIFSAWKSKNDSSDGWTYGNTFFDKTYETATPAGSAIYADTSSKGEISDKAPPITIADITSNSEIDSGCVLAISEGALGQSTFGNNIIYEGSAVQTYCQNLYYTNLNLTNSQKALIKPQTIITNHTNQSTFCTSTEQYIFLSAEGAGIQYNNIKENFGYASYLSTSQYRLSVAYWIRSSGYNSLSQVCSASGSELFPNYSCSSTYYVRPAMVVKLL